MRRVVVTVVSLSAAGVLALSGCSAPESEAFEGTWGEDAPGEPTLTIEDDGSFHGTDGCNNLSGEGTASGEEFEFGDFAVTSRECLGVETLLSDADTATLSGDTLIVHSADGSEIGTLDRR